MPVFVFEMFKRLLLRFHYWDRISNRWDSLFSKSLHNSKVEKIIL